MRNEWAKRGGSTSSKQAASNTLQTGANGDQVQEVYENMKFADGVRDLPMDSKTNGHLSPAAAGMYQLMLQSERSYGDPMQMRAEFLEAQKNSTTSLNLRSHYRDQPKGDKGQTNGAEGEEAMVREVYDAMSDVSGEDWDDVSAAVRADIARTVNMSSALLSGSGGNKEEAILAMATGLMKHNLAMAQDSQGNRFTTIASTPSMTVDRKGNLVPSVKMDAVTLDRFDLATDTPEHQQVSDIMGDTGIVNDAMTAAGHGAQVTMSKGGFETPMVFSAGKAFVIHQDNLPEGGVPPGLFKFVSTDPVSGQHTFKLPDAPKAGEGPRLDVTKNMFLLYEKNTGNWSMRYRDSGPPSTTIKDISDKASAHNADQRAKIDENRDKYPRQASRERWAKRFDPDNSARPDGSEPALQVGDEFKPEPEAPLQDDSNLEIELPVLGTVSKGSVVGRVRTETRKLFGAEPDKWRAPDVEGGLGWPTAGEEHITPVNEEQLSSTKRWVQETLSSLKEAGLATASAIQEESKIQTASEDGAGSGQDRVETVMAISKQQGNRVESTDTDSSDTFDARLADTVISHEGTSLVVYDDSLGKGSGYKEGSKGEPTVGYGFNLNRADARALIEGEGLDYDKVRSGEAIVPEAAARNLLKYTLKRAEGYVRTTFKESKLADHQIMALTSMTYNSRWTKEGPTLIGPNLKSAIAEERWEDAAYEIAWNSEKAPAHLKAGIHARRMREALQFLGPEAASDTEFMQVGYEPKSDEPSMLTQVADTFNDVKKYVSDLDVSFNPVSSAQAKGLKKVAEDAPESVMTRNLQASGIAQIVPQHVRFLFQHLMGSKATITEGEITPEVRGVIRQAVANARKAGRSSVAYSDYPKMANGLDAKMLATWASNSKQEGRYSGASGFLNIVKDSFDPVVAASMSLGKFSFTEQDGKLIITDQYDLVQSKKGGKDLFSKIRFWAPPTPKGESGIPVRLVLNKGK